MTKVVSVGATALTSSGRAPKASFTLSSSSSSVSSTAMKVKVISVGPPSLNVTLDGTPE